MKKLKNILALTFIVLFGLGCSVSLSACGDGKSSTSSVTVTGITVKTKRTNLDVYEKEYFESFEFNEDECNNIFDVKANKSDGSTITIYYGDYTLTLPDGLKNKPC